MTDERFEYAPEDERVCCEHPDQPWDHPNCSLDDDPYGYVHTPPVPPYTPERP